MRLFVVLATGIIDHVFVATRAATCARINPNMNDNTTTMVIRWQQALEGDRGTRRLGLFSSNEMLADHHDFRQPLSE